MKDAVTKGRQEPVMNTGIASSIMFSFTRTLAKLMRFPVSQSGSHQWQFPGHTEPLSATIDAAKPHVRPPQSTSGPCGHKRLRFSAG
jgi:hypothetical protein